MMVNDRRHIPCPVLPIPDAVQFIVAFAKEVGSDNTLDAWAEHTLDALSVLTDSSEAALWVVESNGEFRRHPSPKTDPRQTRLTCLPEHHPLPILLANNPRVRTREHLLEAASKEQERVIADALNTLHADCIVPLICHTRLIGFSTLGLQDDVGDAATVSLIEAVAQTAANALAHLISTPGAHYSQMLMRRTDRLRSLEVMASGFAHEVRNPLTSIKTFVQLAPERQHDPMFIKEFSRLAIDDIHRIERLIQDILDYGRYVVHTPTEEDMNELVSSCLSFISLRASSRRIKLRTDLADRLPTVEVDRQQIKQVVINLLLNALDALREHSKEIVIRTRVEHKPDGPSTICLEIQDDGEGITAAHLEHIFDPFFTTKHSSSPTEVTGLGLTIACQIVQEHRGQIGVESKLGMGSIFRVWLPASPPAR